ncbi:hypothetical protein AVEN_264394-1 [Araneus ventricosus]|uniref:Uncharacterized protein n=1 Tax=Araneus ventricosus TaxID=182803 RepID=A0A4Y2H828_ARAVE|nr:hypothetical protein AVEN_264394-1 [Araneus ventricosus]
MIGKWSLLCNSGSVCKLNKGKSEGLQIARSMEWNVRFGRYLSSHHPQVEKVNKEVQVHTPHHQASGVKSLQQKERQTSSSPPSFAQVAAKKQRHNILLHAKEGQELENTIKGLLQKEINPQKEGFEVSATRPLRNKGLAIDCSSKDHLDNFLEKLSAKSKLTEKIEIKKPGKRFPRCVIYDLEEDTQEADVLQAIATATQAEETEFRISFKMKGKGGKSHYVVAAKPTLTKALLEMKKINIHWSKHNIRAPRDKEVL